MRLMHLCVLLASLAESAHAADPPRPNILWLSAEDLSPNLGCYGDELACTPNLDRFATEGVLYKNAFVVAPVCAPSRSSIITGVYPTTLGTHNMRSRIRLPEHIKCFPEYLRAAGYYCTNNVKTDYQFDPPAAAWDESSVRAHWRNRLTEDQPFFAVFNFTGTHESHVRGDRPAYENTVAALSPDELHDPDALRLPPYHPDTPAARQDWARYYNCVTALDKWVAAHLRDLEEAGLAEDTIVFFWGDHGVGLPRGKRWLYDSGLRVPLVVRIPEKFRRDEQGEPGTRTDELVVLMDLGPTLLNLCGVAVPEYMQGRAFLGGGLSPAREYVFAARDRMDEYYDMTRSVRDKRFKYIRNYEPWKPYAQPLQYAEMSPTMQELRRLHASGELPEAAMPFMAATKPVEELYDTHSDPHELKNLTDDPRHADVLERMRQAHVDWVLQTRDLGLIPEAQLEEAAEAIGTRYAVLQQVGSRDRQLQLIEAAYEASSAIEITRSQGGDYRAIQGLRHDDSAVRYWYAHRMGHYANESKGLHNVLLEALDDADGSVRVAAAKWLAGTEDSDQAFEVLTTQLVSKNWWERLRAANVLQSLSANSPPVIAQVRNAHDEATSAGNDPIAAGYVARTTESILKAAGSE